MKEPTTRRAATIQEPERLPNVEQQPDVERLPNVWPILERFLESRYRTDPATRAMIDEVVAGAEGRGHADAVETSRRGEMA